MTSGQTLEENFHGFRVKWSFNTTEKNTGNNRVSTNRYFTLSFQPQHKEKVHSVYLPEIIKRAEIIQFNNEERKLYTNKGIWSRKDWSSVPFNHPSTFDTLALNPVLKEEIKNDLLTFAKNKEFYAEVGRTWKRGYLLYGPPGTGKTSLIAAIANFLQFDIYDLELKSVENDSHLKKLLISTSNKSIIVMEDVDCSVDLSNRKLNVKDEEKTSLLEKGVSLSGVLNFVDGLWSSCGGERLIILTTNFKGNLDSALLRPGRMDKHIHLSYIDFAAFKMLTFNYLHIEYHMLMKEVEEVLPLAKVTAAEIAEVFMSSVNDGDTGMKNATELIKKRLNKSSKEMDTGKIV